MHTLVKEYWMQNIATSNGGIIGKYSAYTTLTYFVCSNLFGQSFGDRVFAAGSKHSNE